MTRITLRNQTFRGRKNRAAASATGLPPKKPSEPELPSPDPERLLFLGRARLIQACLSR